MLLPSNYSSELLIFVCLSADCQFAWPCMIQLKPVAFPDNTQSSADVGADDCDELLTALIKRARAYKTEAEKLHDKAQAGQQPSAAQKPQINWQQPPWRSVSCSLLDWVFDRLVVAFGACIHATSAGLQSVQR